MKKTIIIALFLIPLFGTAQTAKKQSAPAATAATITDSTNIFSVKDITVFNESLKKNISYEAYLKMTPESTLGALVNWKIEQLKPKEEVAAPPKK